MEMTNMGILCLVLAGIIYNVLSHSIGKQIAELKRQLDLHKASPSEHGLPYNFNTVFIKMQEFYYYEEELRRLERLRDKGLVQCRCKTDVEPG